MFDTFGVWFALLCKTGEWVRGALEDVTKRYMGGWAEHCITLLPKVLV